MTHLFIIGTLIILTVLALSLHYMSRMLTNIIDRQIRLLQMVQILWDERNYDEEE